MIVTILPHISAPTQPPHSGHSSNIVGHADRRRAFRCPFMAAIDMLPNLHTFISRPMTSTRIINPLHCSGPSILQLGTLLCGVHHGGAGEL